MPGNKPQQSDGAYNINKPLLNRVFSQMSSKINPSDKSFIDWREEFKKNPESVKNFYNTYSKYAKSGWSNPLGEFKDADQFYNQVYGIEENKPQQTAQSYTWDPNATSTTQKIEPVTTHTSDPQANAQEYQKRAIETATKKEKQIHDEFKMSTGLYKKATNGDVVPVQADPTKFNQMWDKKADGYFIEYLKPQLQQKDKPVGTDLFGIPTDKFDSFVSMVQQYYHAPSIEAKKDIQKQIQEIKPDWNPLPQEQWDILDHEKTGIYEYVAATNYHGTKQYEQHPILTHLNDALGFEGGNTTEDSMTDANNLTGSFARAYYLGENFTKEGNFHTGMMNFIQSLGAKESGKYQTDEQYNNNLKDIYSNYFYDKNEESGVAPDKIDKKSNEDAQNILDMFQKQSLDPGFIKRVSGVAGGLIGSLPAFIAMSAAGGEAANLANLDKLVASDDLVTSLGGRLLRTSFTSGVPMAMMDDNKRRGFMMGLAFGGADVLASKLGYVIDGAAYNGVIKRIMGGITKGTAAATTQSMFDAVQFYTNSEDFSKDLKDKGLDWLSQEGKNYLASLTVFSIMGVGAYDKTAAENLRKEFEERKQKTRDKAEKEKLTKQEKDITAVASQKGSDLNTVITNQAVGAPDSKIHKPVVTHNVPDGNIQSKHIDMEDKSISMPPQQFKESSSAVDHVLPDVKSKGISEATFTDKNQAEEFKKAIDKNTLSYREINTGTEQNPQIHYIVYDKSKAANADALFMLRNREASGEDLNLDDVAQMAGLKGHDPVQVLSDMKKEAESHSLGNFASNIQAKIDDINSGKNNQGVPNDLATQLKDVEESKKTGYAKNVDEAINDVRAKAAQYGLETVVEPDGKIQVKNGSKVVVSTDDLEYKYSKDGLSKLQDVIDQHAKSTDVGRASLYEQAKKLAKDEGLNLSLHNGRLIARSQEGKNVVTSQVGYKNLESYKQDFINFLNENNLLDRISNLPSDKKDFTVEVPGLRTEDVKKAIDDIHAGKATYNSEQLLNELNRSFNNQQVTIKQGSRSVPLLMDEFLNKTKGDLGKPQSIFKEQTKLDFTDDNSSIVREKNVSDFLENTSKAKALSEKYNKLPTEKKNAIEDFINDVVVGGKNPTEEQKQLASQNAAEIEQRVTQKQIEGQSKPYLGMPEQPTSPVEQPEEGIEEKASAIEAPKRGGRRTVKRATTVKEAIEQLTPEMQKRTTVIQRSAIDKLAGSARMGKFKEYLTQVPEYEKYAALDTDDAIKAMFKDGVIDINGTQAIIKNMDAYSQDLIDKTPQSMKRISTKAAAESSMEEHAPVSKNQKGSLTSKSYSFLLDTIKKGDAEKIRTWTGSNGKTYGLDGDVLKHSDVQAIIDEMKRNGNIDKEQWQEMSKQWKNQQMKQPQGKEDIYKIVTQSSFIPKPLTDYIQKHIVDYGTNFSKAAREALRYGDTPEKKEIIQKYLKGNRLKTFIKGLSLLHDDETGGNSFSQFLGRSPEGFAPDELTVMDANNHYRNAIVQSYDDAKGDIKLFKQGLMSYAADVNSEAETMTNPDKKEALKIVSEKINNLIKSVRTKDDMNIATDLTIRGIRYKVGSELVSPHFMHEADVMDKLQHEKPYFFNDEERDNFLSLLPTDEIMPKATPRSNTIENKITDFVDRFSRTPQYLYQLARTERGKQIMKDMYSSVDKSLVQIPKEIRFGMQAKLLDIEQNLSKEQKSNLSEALYRGKYIDGKIYSSEELSKGISTPKGNITPDENTVQAYQQVHNVISEVQNYIIATERMKDKEYPTLSPIAKKAWEQQRREELFGLEGYVPLTREGDYVIIAHGPDAHYNVGETKNVFRVKTEKEAESLAQDLRKKGYSGYSAAKDEGEHIPLMGSMPNYYKIREQVKDYAPYLDRNALDSMYDAIRGTKDYDEMSQSEKDAIDLLEKQKNKIMAGTAAVRKKPFKAVPGVEPTWDNFRKSLMDMVERETHNYGRTLADFNFNKLWEQLPQEDIHIKNLSKEWHDGLSKKASIPMGNIVSNAMYFKYLAGNMTHVGRVFLSGFSTLPTYLSSQGIDVSATGEFGKRFMSGISDAMSFTRNKTGGLSSVITKGAAKMGIKSSGIDPKLTMQLETMYQRGIIGTTSIDFALNSVHGKWGTAFEKLANNSVLNAEFYARSQAAIMGLWGAEKKGLIGEQALDFATDVVYKTTNNYNKTNAPLIFGRNPDLANVAKMYLIFKQAHQNYNQMMSDIFLNTFDSWKDFRNTLRSQTPSAMGMGAGNLFNPLTVASRALPMVSTSIRKVGFKGTVGVSALIGAMAYGMYGATNSMISGTKKELKEHLSDGANEVISHDAQNASDFIHNGMFGLIGIDGTNIFDLGKTISFDSHGFTNASSALEAQVGYGWQAMKEGDYKKLSTILLPNSVGNWYKANEYANDGLKLQKGLVYQPDSYEKHLLQFGLKPLNLTKAYAAKEMAKSLESKRVGILRYIKNHGGKITPDIQQEIDDFNQSCVEAATQELPTSSLQSTTEFTRHLNDMQITHKGIHTYLKRK